MLVSCRCPGAFLCRWYNFHQRFLIFPFIREKPAVSPAYTLSSFQNSAAQYACLYPMQAQQLPGLPPCRTPPCGSRGGCPVAVATSHLPSQQAQGVCASRGPGARAQPADPPSAARDTARFGALASPGRILPAACARSPWQLVRGRGSRPARVPRKLWVFPQGNQPSLWPRSRFMQKLGTNALS